MKKEIAEKNFEEFWEEEEKKTEDKEAIKAEKRLMLETLRSKGFSEREINEMKMEKAWKICEPVIWEGIERQSWKTAESVSRVASECSRFMQKLWQNPEKRILLLKDKALRRDLFRLAASWDDLDRGLFQSEETLLQFVEELRKKLKEKEKQK